jgi:hypothetical protein
MLNRSAVVVRPAAPYFAWAAALPDAHLTQPPPQGSRVYLVPPLEDPGEAEELLNIVCTAIFELELNEWHTKAADWPRDRSLNAFKKWFHHEIVESIADLGSDPIEDDDLYR